MNIDNKIHLKPMICDACELGTPIEKKRKTVRNKAIDALACIHVDTFKLLPTGYSGQKYGMILTDEATSERWGYTFNARNSAFECLKVFISYAQTQWGETRQIKAWRMDGGTENAPNQFRTCARNSANVSNFRYPMLPGRMDEQNVQYEPLSKK